MHFSIVLCRASMHWWEYSSGMLICSAVMAFLMAFFPSKRTFSMAPLSLRKKSHTKIRWIRDGCFSTVIFLTAQHTQFCYFSGKPKSSVIFFQTLSFFKFNSQPMIATNHLLYSLDVDFSPACWRPLPPLLESSFTSLRPSLNLLYYFKKTLFVCLVGWVLWHYQQLPNPVYTWYLSK